MVNEKLQKQLDIASQIREKNERKAKIKQEKENTNRRMSEWRTRKRQEGFKPYEIWLTQEEYEVVKKMIDLFRKNKKEAESAQKKNEGENNK